MAHTATGYHKPVLLEQTMEALHIQPQGIYLDGTAGGGGHSAAIAKQLKTGRLIALDQDPDAIAAAGERLQGLPATVVQSNFRDMDRVLDKLGVDGVDGILLDIGVSSHQLDTPERGFSYHHDAPLDMRMSQSGDTAADLIARLSESELAFIFYRYGEEKFSRGIARAIVRERDKAPIESTLQLADLVSRSVPAAARRDGHPARRVFQALRIAVNGELDCLSAALDTAFDCLNPGGDYLPLAGRCDGQDTVSVLAAGVCLPEGIACMCMWPHPGGATCFEKAGGCHRTRAGTKPA